VLSSETIELELISRTEERLTAVKLTREAREASIRTGHALLGTAIATFPSDAIRRYAQRVDLDLLAGNHAVVNGVVAASLGVAPLAAVAADLLAFATSWVTATVRLALTDHRDAQVILGQIQPVIVEAAADAANRDVEDIFCCAPMIDLMSMRHEASDLRLFAS
jgi:urease accessory protein